MIAATRPRASCDRGSPSDQCCPACGSSLSQNENKLRCNACHGEFPVVAGIADLRLKSDRYLSLHDERAKATRLAQLANSMSFRELCHAYYEMTGDVDAKRAKRYMAHLAAGETRAMAFLDFLPTRGRVLEVGCGTGGMLATAAKRGLDIEGVDIALRWLVLGRKRLEPIAADLALTAADAKKLPWPDATFSAIFADSVLEHVDDPVAALREWRRIAKPGASLTLVSPNCYSLLPDPHVGLFGLGFLPRAWQGPYVRLRRKCSWLVRPISAREAGNIARAAGWQIQTIAAAPAPDSARNSKLRAIYERGRRYPLTASFLRQFGPLWFLRAIREDPQ